MRLTDRHEITRLEAFSDAVFGFALTLLVVSLEVPRSYEELIGVMAGFPAFACCLALLIWLWHEHTMFFRRFDPGDGVTVVINGAFLFVVLFYVYPLKFMFNSLFARWVHTPQQPEPMELWQLANASAIYATGFILMMLMFVLLHARAYAKRQALGLSDLEVFDVVSMAGHHTVSGLTGVVSLSVALWAPLRFAPLSPMALALMGPGHAFWGSRRGKARKALAERVHPRDAVPAS